MKWVLSAALVLTSALGGACASALKPLPPPVASVENQPPEDANSLYEKLRKLLREISAEPAAGRREQLSGEAVKLGQRCDQAAPGSALCDYGLALALGVQARERPATAHDGLALMVERLQRAAAKDPGLDHSGPERVLGLVLVRAPGWPTGPGDPETGLETARKAAARAPDYAPNWLAVAEAADAMSDADARHEAAEKADLLAQAAVRAGEPESEGWLSDAKKLLNK
jgi:hypothetical protein